MKLPKHINLTIEHNPHAINYQTAARWLSDPEMNGHSDHVDRAEMERTNEIWLIQWYPDDPASSYCVAASTLEKALASANQP